MIRLLIVDDDTTSRSGIITMISRERDIDVVGSLSSGDEAVAFCDRERPDVILMDVSMPCGLSGTEAAAVIRSRHPDIKIVFLSLNFNDDLDNVNLKDGYFLKENMDRSTKFALAVKCAYHNLVAYSPEIISRILPERHTKNQPLNSGSEAALSLLEQQIVEKLVEGKTYTQIASGLNYSDGYIRSVANRLMARMNFRNAKELVVWGARRGM